LTLFSLILNVVVAALWLCCCFVFGLQRLQPANNAAVPANTVPVVRTAQQRTGNVTHYSTNNAGAFFMTKAISRDCSRK